MFAHSGKFCNGLINTSHTALAAEHLHHLEEGRSSRAAADGNAHRTEELSTAQAKFYRQVAHGCFHDIMRPCFAVQAMQHRSLKYQCRKRLPWGRLLRASSGAPAPIARRERYTRGRAAAGYYRAGHLLPPGAPGRE